MAPTWAVPGLFEYAKGRLFKFHQFYSTKGIPQGIRIKLENHFFPNWRISKTEKLRKRLKSWPRSRFTKTKSYICKETIVRTLSNLQSRKTPEETFIKLKNSFYPNWKHQKLNFKVERFCKKIFG